MPLPVGEWEVTSQGFGAQALLARLKEKKWTVTRPARRIIDSHLFVPTRGVTYRFDILSARELIATRALPSKLHFADIAEAALKRGYRDMTVESTMLLLQRYTIKELGAGTLIAHHTPLNFSVIPERKELPYRLIISPSVPFQTLGVKRCDTSLGVTRLDAFLFHRDP